jgi:2'-5' RNA ligase
MRLFVACSLPPEVKLAIEARSAAIRAGVRGSWVRPDSLHLTLAFIGEQPEEVAPAILASLQKHLGETHALASSVSGVGTFPNARRARVGWLALAGEERLNDLARLCREALLEARVPFDEKPFRPHLTLVRFRDGASPAQSRMFIEHFAGFVSDDFVIDHVSLYSSRLSSEGAIHTELGRVTLGEATRRE